MPGPWMSWIGVNGASQGLVVSVVNENEASEAIASGGSTVSRSVTSAAVTVTVQVSPRAKSPSGSSVRAAPPDASVTVAWWVPLVVQEIEYQPAAVSTGSEKLMATSASTAMSVASAAGVVAVTVGAVVGAAVDGVGAQAVERVDRESVPLRGGVERVRGVGVAGEHEDFRRRVWSSVVT